MEEGTTIGDKIAEIIQVVVSLGGLFLIFYFPVWVVKGIIRYYFEQKNRYSDRRDN
jgi:flagellar biogenesis protein FliO